MVAGPGDRVSPGSFKGPMEALTSTYTSVPESIQQGRLAHIRHPDNEDIQFGHMRITFSNI